MGLFISFVFFVFALCGPYVEPDQRLKINLIDDNNKSKNEDSRKDTCKLELEEKKNVARSDTSGDRGLTADQRIKISNLNERRQERRDRLRETNIVSLSIENSAISTLLMNAERRAEARCKEYDPNNIFWKKVDELTKQQEDVVRKMSLLNSMPDVSNFDPPVIDNSDKVSPIDEIEFVSNGLTSTASDVPSYDKASVPSDGFSTKKRVSKRAKHN